MNKALKQAIDSAIKSYNNAREKLHAVACKCVEHTLKHGDVTPLAYLLEQMGNKSQTRHRIAAWVRHHGRFEKEDGTSSYFINANIDKDGKVSVKVAKEEVRNQFTVEPFEAGPYWEVLETQTVKTAWELEAALTKLVKKAIDEGKTAADIKNTLAQVLKNAA